MSAVAINEQIAAPKLRVIDEQGKLIGEISRDQALYLAYDSGLDLVLVDPVALPAVAKLVDYGKFSYQEAKRARAAKGAKAAELKEIRLSANIEKHDFEMKLKRAQQFLAQGDKVLVRVRMRGRQAMFSDNVKEMLYQFENQTGGSFDSAPKRLGNNWTAVLVAKK